MIKVFLIALLTLGGLNSFSYAERDGHMQDHMSDSPGYNESGESAVPSYGMMGHRGYGGMGYITGPGMWGYDANRYNQFLNDTVDLRRELHNRQFDYKEALENRDVTNDDLIRMEKEMLELQMKIYEKWWNRTGP